MEPSEHDTAPPALLLQGIAQFNRGLFYEQHDTLEELWRAETRPVRELYQGILQIGVAFYQLSRGNFKGMVVMLERGREHLAPFEPVCQSVDVEALRKDALRCLDEVKRLGPERLDEFPRALIPKVSFVLVG